MTPNLLETTAFLTALAGSPNIAMTYQSFTDNKPDPLPDAWEDPLARIIHGTLAERSEELISLNGRGAGIFVTVNETDGRGRKAMNIVKVRAQFVDFDTQRLRPFAAGPSFEVESSPGRSHAYWLADGDATVEGFTSTQKKLIKYYMSDPSVHDLPRVMRLPGFWHQKREPFLVRFIPGTGEVFSVAKLLQAHPVEKQPNGRKKSPETPPRASRTENLLRVVREHAAQRPWTISNRHESAKATATHARKLGLPEEHIRAIVQELATAAGLPEPEVNEILKWTISNVAPDPTERTPGEETDEEDENERKSSCATELIEIGRNALLFHDERGDGYAAFTSGSVRRLMKIRGAAFTSELCRLFSERHKFKRAANGEAVAAARHVLEALATFKGEEHRLYTRFARHEGAIYIDMADAAWRAIRVTPGRWEIVDTPPLLFRRFPHMRPLPEPVRGGDLAQLFEPFALGEAEKILLTSYVVTIPLGDIPRPLLLPNGPQGSGKTTLLKRIGATIDPTGIDDLDLSGEPRELAQLLDQHAVAFFDNVVKIQDAAARLLCKAATGGGFEKRRLYTDEESIILSFKRAVMISAINVPTHAPDLLDRSLLVPLDRIPPEKRQCETDLWSAFEAQRPAILGGLLDALAGAMAIYPTLRLAELPRMADFAAWGAAVAEALGLTLGSRRGAEAFLHAYKENVARQTEEVIEADPVARAVKGFITDEKKWRGTATALFTLLKNKHEAEFEDKESGWPRRVDTFARRLREVLATLADEGIILQFNKEGKGRNRIIQLAVKTVTQASGASVASAEAQQSHPAADASGGGPTDGVLPGVRLEPATGAVGGQADGTDSRPPLSTANEESASRSPNNGCVATPPAEEHGTHRGSSSPTAEKETTDSEGALDDKNR